jgi:hypothetical protein
MHEIIMYITAIDYADLQAALSTAWFYDPKLIPDVTGTVSSKWKPVTLPILYEQISGSINVRLYFSLGHLS